MAAVVCSHPPSLPLSLPPSLPPLHFILLRTVQQKRDAEEQEKAVAARSEKIAEEEARCMVLADAAQKDLDEALPALQEAVKVLG